MTAAFEREMDELVSVVEELEDTLDVQDVEHLRELSESMYEATIKETHKVEGENEEPSKPAFLVSCFLSRSVRFATIIRERHWSRIRDKQDLKEGLFIRRSS